MEAPVRPRARLAHVQGIPIGLRFEPGPLGLVYPVSKHGVLPYELSLGGNLLNLLAEMKRKFARRRRLSSQGKTWRAHLLVQLRK